MDGTLIGSITQNPVGIGKCVVDSLAKAIKGEKLEKVIDTGYLLVRQDQYQRSESCRRSLRLITKDCSEPSPGIPGGGFGLREPREAEPGGHSR